MPQVPPSADIPPVYLQVACVAFPRIRNLDVYVEAHVVRDQSLGGVRVSNTHGLPTEGSGHLAKPGTIYNEMIVNPVFKRSVSNIVTVGSFQTGRDALRHG